VLHRAPRCSQSACAVEGEPGAGDLGARRRYARTARVSLRLLHCGADNRQRRAECDDIAIVVQQADDLSRIRGTDIDQTIWPNPRHNGEGHLNASRSNLQDRDQRRSQQEPTSHGDKDDAKHGCR
jgi:hypothetical protein